MIILKFIVVILTVLAAKSALKCPEWNYNLNFQLRQPEIVDKHYEETGKDLVNLF